MQIKSKVWLNKIKLLFKLLIVLIILLLLLDVLFPLPIDRFDERKFAQVVVDKFGQPLRAFPDKQGVWRYPIELSEVSELYLQALINYEDRYYYKHFGVNPLAIIRAFGQWIWHGKLISGASTLTMQVARILKPHKKSFSGKIIQIFMALQLEWHYSKREILTYYINYAPFGGPLEGVQAASYAYLGKAANELTASEAALLAVMPQSPSRFRPDRYPQRAQRARNKLLKRLQQFNVWDSQTINEAIQENVFAQYNTRPQIAPLLTRRLVHEYPNNKLIKSTIDGVLQVELENLVKDYIRGKAEKMSSAVLLMDNSTAEALAYIGSADFLNEKRAGHVDMIGALRSPGSTLKPFIYGLAIDEGLIHSESLLFDVPQSFAGYRPKNFTDSFSGAVSVSQALGRSLNMPAVQILNKLSPEKFYAKMKNAHLDIKLPVNAKPNLSLALGGGSVKLEQLLSVFSALGRKGKTRKIKYTKMDKSNEYNLLSQGSAWVIQNILASVPLKNKLYSHSLIPQKSIAFKTGTSYGYRDAWVLASNAKYSIAIWLGNPDGSYLENNTGRSSAVPLLRKIMAILPAHFNHKLKQPYNVSLTEICWPLGRKKEIETSEFCHKKRKAYILDNTIPPTFEDELNDGFSVLKMQIQIDKKSGKRVLPTCAANARETKTVAVWPQVLEPWLAKPFRRENLLPPFSDDCLLMQSNTTLEIIGIHNNAFLYPEPPKQAIPPVELNVKGSTGHVYWFVNRIMQKSSTAKLRLKKLKIGNYHVTVTDDAGKFAELSFNVSK